MLGAAPRAAAVVFVLDLHGHQGAAVAPEPPLQLRPDLREEAPDRRQVGRVVAAQRDRAGVAAGLQPVGQAAVAGLGMHPRPGTQAQQQAGGVRQVDETPQVAPAAPVEATLLGLVVVPEDVAGDDVDAARLHAAQLVGPFAFGAARVVELAHHRQPGLAVALDEGAVDAQRAVRTDPAVAECEEVALDEQRVGAEAEKRHG